MKRGLAIAFAAVALFSVAKGDVEQMKKAIQKCKTSENLDSLDGLKKEKVPATEEEKCFIGCLTMDMKLLSSDGQYDPVSTKEMINSCELLKDKPEERSDALQVADDCTGKVAGCSGYCECGPKTVGCLMRGMMDKGYQESFIRIDKILQKLDG